ncbi:GNAT family N-acetyltransferase [soil metagenome]
MEVLPTIRLDKAGEPFSVRSYTRDDRAALEAFYEAFHPKRAAQGMPPEGARRVERWLDIILPRGKQLIAERGAILIGHSMLMPTREPDVVEYAIYVHQHFRGRGVGTEMNRAAVELARAAGLARVWLSVEPGNRAAVRSYEKVGFRFLPGAILSLEAEMVIDLHTLPDPHATGAKLAEAAPHRLET